MKGGARDGAGRKPSGRATKTIRVDPELWDWFGSYVAESGQSISDHLEAFIRKAQRKVKRSAATPAAKGEAVAAKPRSRPAQPEATPSVSRNAPCPCGSGRKFKKCCGRGNSDRRMR